MMSKVLPITVIRLTETQRRILHAGLAALYEREVGRWPGPVDLAIWLDSAFTVSQIVELINGPKAKQCQ